jgi:putative ABC transport system permease protein
MSSNWKQLVRARLAPLRLAPERELEIVEELALHLEAAYETALARGLTEEAARAQALAQITDWPLLESELARAETPAHKLSRALATEPWIEQKGGLQMEALWQDLRYGWRAWRKQPGFAFIALLTLALGIGANTAVFSVVNAALLRPLPYAQPERLVMISESDAQQKVQSMAASGPNFVDWRSQARSFERMAVFVGEENFNLTGEASPERVTGATVSEDFFPTLGVTPALGRAFVSEETRPGAPPVVVLSHALWQRRYGGDRGIIGQAIRVNGENATIVGVMPPQFQYPAEAEIWLPFASALDQLNRSLYMLKVVGRLKTGVTLAQARTELDSIAQRLAQQYPETNKGRGVYLQSLQDGVVGDVKSALYVLLGAVLFVLLIVCANVANLLLGRAAVRQRELAIRAALGARRIRLLRQLLVESLLLAFSGGALGLLLAFWGTNLLFKLNPAVVPGVTSFTLDVRVLGFTLLASLLTGVLFGLAPAWQMSGTDLHAALQSNGRGSATGKHRLSSALVVAETALALVLLVGAGLLIKSFWRLINVETGFEAENVLTVQLQLPEKDYAEQPRVAAFYDQLLQRIQTLPGVQAAGLVNTLPMIGVFMQGLTVEGAPPQTSGRQPITAFRVATPGYFGALDIPLLSGRAFQASDRAETAGVVIVDQMTARRHWTEGQALGKRIKLGGPQSPWLTVIGVVGDVRYHGLEYKIFPTVYVPHAQSPFRGMMLAVRTAAEPLALVTAVKGEVAALDRNLPVAKIQTLAQIVSGSVTQQRFNLMLLGAFAALALALAAVGIYGVIAYAVTQRTREFGIRLAVGAQTGDVLRLVIGQGIKLVFIGVLLGLGGALALTRLMKTLLFNVSATDPLTFVVIALILLGVALLACWIPARRATRVDPLVALRCE